METMAKRTLKWDTALLYVAIAVLLVVLAFMLLSRIGERTILSEKVGLLPGGQKTYQLPPGWVTVNVTPEAPIDTKHASFLVGQAESHNIIGGHEYFWNLFGVQYTVRNPNQNATNVTVQISTGQLNPFGYV